MDSHKRKNQLDLNLPKRIRGESSNSSSVTNAVVHLPDDVLNTIFTFLPIKLSIQTCFTSKRFNKTWLYNRKLIFGKEFARGCEREHILNIINHVLRLHKGQNIDNFCLYIDPTGMETIVDGWIKTCIDKGVAELDLDFYRARFPFRLFREFFNVESIRILKLCFCELELPPKWTGLRFLNTLVLRRIEIFESFIESLFSNCLFLENFELIQCYDVSKLKIYGRSLRNFKVLKIGECFNLVEVTIASPSLQSFMFHGNLCFFKFIDAWQLKDVMMNFALRRKFLAQQFRIHRLVLQLSHIQALSISSIFLEGLSGKITNGGFTDLSFIFFQLEELQLFMKPGSHMNLYDIASFLKHCPFIEKLFIDLTDFNFECGYYWELHQKHLLCPLPHQFMHLKFIKIMGFRPQEHELGLVKFLLEKAPFLETLVLVTPKNNRNSMPIYFDPNRPPLDKFFNYWKSSPTVEVKVFRHSSDNSHAATHLSSWY